MPGLPSAHLTTGVQQATMSQENIYDSYMLEANQAFTDAILGPPIAGCLVGLMLAGAFIQQYFNYLGGRLYSQDSFRLKCFLHAVMLLAGTQSALTFYGAYHYSTWQQRDSDTLFSQTAADCFTLTFVGIEGALVQLYLAQRGTALMGRSRWRYLYWVFVLAGVLGGLAGSILYLVASELSRSGHNPQFFNVASGLYQISGAFVNALITVTLVVTLRHNMTNFNKQTDSILSALIKVSVESAAPSALVAVTGAVLGFVFDDQSLYANVTWAFFPTLSGLYALSLLAALNGRERVREAAANSQAGTYHFNREVLTTVESHASPRMLEGGGGSGLRPSLSRLSGRKGDEPGTPVVAVGLSGFLDPGEARTRSRGRLEKDGL